MDLATITAASAFGLCIGTFLNVVIHRLPLMIARDGEPENEDHVEFDLAFPASHCPKCEAKIAWFDNIPLISFLILGGRCRSCKTPISWRYPTVEALTAALFCWSAVTHTSLSHAIALSAFFAALLALAVIDLQTLLLPDAITQPLIWAGLLASCLAWTQVSTPDAVIGAIAGYMSLWVLAWVFSLLAKTEGIGHGDMKMLAAIGAWLGWQALPMVCVLASAAALGVGMWRWCITGTKGREGLIPLGPFLALGAILTA